LLFIIVCVDTVDNIESFS